MNRKQFGEKFGVSINTPKNWFGNMGLVPPETYDGNHVVLCEIYKKLSSVEPKLSEEQIIESCLPFMKAANVTPIDPSTHPLTAGSVASGGPGAGEENTLAVLVAESMEDAAVELAPIAAAALVRGLSSPDARAEFKKFVGYSLRSGVRSWVDQNVQGVTVTSVKAEGVLPTSENKSLPEATEPVEQPVVEGKA